MVNIKEQIISADCPVKLKPEKLFIKEHIRTNKGCFVHFINYRSFIAKAVVPSLHNISVVVHKQTGFQIWVGLNCFINSLCKFFKVNTLAQLQQVRNIINCCTHICGTLNENTLLGIRQRINFTNLSLLALSCTCNKLFKLLNGRIILYIRGFDYYIKRL